jgi:hypothetical protein
VVKRRLIFTQWEDASERAPFNRLEAAQRLADLPPDQTVLVHGTQTTAVEVDQVGSDTEPTMLQLLALREYDNRPVDWGPGQGASPISMLAERYPADITHVVLWGDNLAAYDSYPNAPGLSRLSSYLRDRADARVHFSALYDPTIIEQLDDLEGVRAVTYGIHSHEKASAAANAGLLSGFAPPRFNPATTPSLTVTLGMSRKGPRDEYLDPEVSEQMLQAAAHAEQLFDSLKVRGRSRSRGRSVTLDLLSQRVAVETELPRAPEGGNLAARPAVYAALRQARRDKIEVLRQAASAALLSEHA